MFSKPLFKQSCKASRTMWIIITFAVCFTLACVMLIAGGSDITKTKNAIQDTIIEGELTSQMQSRSLNYYLTSKDALEHFDNEIVTRTNNKLETVDFNKIYTNAYNNAILSGKSENEAVIIGNNAVDSIKNSKFTQSYKEAVVELASVYIPSLIEERNIDPDSKDAEEIAGLIMIVLNPMTEINTYMFDDYYISYNEIAPRYNVSDLMSVSPAERKIYRDNYSAKNCTIFMAGKLTEIENISLIINALKDYGVTTEKYQNFGFSDYNKIKGIADTSIVNFRANFIHRMENIKDNETEESIIKDLTKDISQSLLASLPGVVADALDEIGQADLYGILVGSIFFKMAGLLLPIIYLIMTANSLIAGQVDSGSMAYILSSSVKRRTVTFTQAIFLVGSLFLMFTCSAITSVICLAIVDVETKLTYGKLILMNFGAFLVLFAMSGICFLSSCWFNRSKRSMGIGGGLNMFFLVATMLGLFGSEVLPSILRMEALNLFNYVSIISLFDVINILDGGLNFIWKLAILVVIGIICYVIGSEKFARKDLPL